MSYSSLGLKRDALIKERTGRCLVFTGRGSHGGLYHLDICWKDDRAGHKQSRFLECIDNNILTQVVEGPTRKYVLRNVMLKSNEELTIDVKVGGCLGGSDHRIVEFRIL